MTSRFFVDKTTGTFSDELLAAGFIRLLEGLFHQHGETQPEIVQTDFGHYYDIRTTPALDLEQVKTETTPFVLAPILRTVKNSKGLPDLPDNPIVVVDYEAEREKRSAFFDAYSNLEGTLKRAYAIGDDENFPFDAMPAAPHERWNIFGLLNAPPMPINGYNKLMIQWRAIGDAGETGAVCRMLCDLFRQTPNDLDATIKNAWKPLAKPYKWTETVTASQFFNPSQGKGINRPLPNSVGLGNVRDFWLREWLKAVGFYHIAFTGRVRGANDRKTYVPAVGRADLVLRRQIQEAFRNKMRFSETAVRSDIFTITRYLKAFIERLEAAQRETANEQEQALLAIMSAAKRPSNFVRGFHTVFYKSLGTSAATMNISFLNVPGWVEIRQPEDIAIFREILEEHENIVDQFAENKGEEIELLQQYRDFIVADNFDPFFEFTTAYSSWIISQGEKKGGFPPRRLSTHNLRRLILSNQPNLSKILDSSGFVNIARAIRESTVGAQYRKNSKNDKRYTVRYGLGRDLIRHSQYPDDLMAELSEFLFAYNAENAQVLERYPKERYPQYTYYRWDVQTEDIKDILNLIDEYKNPNLVAKLLVAYGYASEYRARQESTDDES